MLLYATITEQSIKSVVGGDHSGYLSKGLTSGLEEEDAL